MLEDVGGESSRNQTQEEKERESQIARKKSLSDSRESKAVNEAEQVRCVDRFLSSL